MREETESEVVGLVFLWCQNPAARNHLLARIRSKNTRDDLIRKISLGKQSLRLILLPKTLKDINNHQNESDVLLYRHF